MELKPCAKCGIRVSDVDIQQGDGVNSGGKFYCLACAKELDLKSDYSAVEGLSTKKALSDTQFFTRAGRLFEELEASAKERPRKRRPRDMGRPKTAPPRPRATAGRSPAKEETPAKPAARTPAKGPGTKTARAPKTGRKKSRFALLIGGLVGFIILLLLFIIILLVSR